jgi:adenylate cyclase class IV
MLRQAVCTMQVEVKLRLADQAAHDKLVDLLKADQTHLYRQHNLFYDGPNHELSSQRTVLRVRWFNDDEKVVITVKGKMAVTDGVGRAAEDEDEVPMATARQFEADASKILSVDLPVINSLKECAPGLAMSCWLPQTTC